MSDMVGERTLRDLLDERTLRAPEKTWLVFESRDGSVSEWTYAEFTRDVDRLAVGLRGLGIGYGDKVTLHLGNSPEFLLMFFAVATIGAVMVPSNVSNRASELRHIIEFSDSVALVTQPDYVDVADDAAREVEAIKHRILARSTDDREGYHSFGQLLQDGAPTVCPASSEDDFQLLFTSGTTARPKGVLLTHANALWSGERSSRSMYLDSTERCLTALPVFHVNAQSLTILSALTVGGTVVLLEEYRATRFWEQVRRHRATQISLVAMLVRTLLAQPAAATDLDHDVRRTFYALNITDAEKNEFERRFGLELVNGYGLSEAMTEVTVAPLFGPKRWPSIGRPAYDRLVRVVNEEGDDVPLGEPGEIIVHGTPGRTIMKGYYKDPAATAAVLRDGWLYTGDNAYRDAEGNFFFFDRKKDVIKRAGENVSASEVEFVLSDHPDVEDVAVIGVPDDIRDEAVKAFVVTRSGSPLTVEDIREFCRERLAAFKVPTIVENRDSLPKTSIGKIEKKLLRTEADGQSPA